MRVILAHAMVTIIKPVPDYQHNTANKGDDGFEQVSKKEMPPEPANHYYQETAGQQRYDFGVVVASARCEINNWNERNNKHGMSPIMQRRQKCCHRQNGYQYREKETVDCTNSGNAYSETVP